MYSKVIILGNLGKDPTMAYAPSGDAMTKFSVAANESYTNSAGEKVKKTTWFNVTTWKKLAEICQTYLHKGSKVYIEGTLQADPATGGPRVWTGQDGASRASFEIRAELVRFLNSRDEDEGSAPVAKSATPFDESDDTTDVAAQAPIVVEEGNDPF
jgi:single-strand DNA-binding protein